MKAYMFIRLLFAACVTTSIMSMEQKNSDTSRLNLLLGHTWRIRQYSAENMENAIKPSELLGKKITKAFPLNEHDSKAVGKALIDAVQEQKTVTVSYALENKHFLATITPLIWMKNNKQKNSCFVKVTPDSAMQ